LIPVTDLGETAAPYGGVTQASANAQRVFLEAATAAALQGRVSALMTAPITKASISKSGFAYPGQTEYLQVASGVKGVTMMLAGPRLRVALVTTHLALSEVSAALSEEGIRGAVLRSLSALKSSFGIESPRLALCGLNPHAGEQGRFGREEIELIQPAADRLRAEGIALAGPLAADAALARAARGDFDCVIALYHDQGLGAAKAVDQDQSVNLTLGLPFPRTSPDHGSALDIAGQGVARVDATVAALKLAAKLALGTKAPTMEPTGTGA